MNNKLLKKLESFTEKNHIEEIPKESTWEEHRDFMRIAKYIIKTCSILALVALLVAAGSELTRSSSSVLGSLSNGDVIKIR